MGNFEQFGAHTAKNSRIEDANGMTREERQAFLRDDMSPEERQAAIDRFKLQQQKEVHIGSN
jgi:hypothetical protein